MSYTLISTSAQYHDATNMDTIAMAISQVPTKQQIVNLGIS